MQREILVIDSAERETFWRTLKSDCRVLFASTAKDGLHMLSENVDIIFLGMKLPDMSGLEMLRRIKKEHPSAAVSIIAEHGTEEPGPEESVESMHFARKPLQADEILGKIRTLLKEDHVSPASRNGPSAIEDVCGEQYPDIPARYVDGVLRVRDFIACNYSESLTLTAACRMASISRTYFCHFFKRVTGYSLRSYHNVVKVRMADEFLRDGRFSIKEIAHKLGFDDPNYFSTTYKRLTGVSPRRRQTTHRTPHPDTTTEESLQF